MKQKNLYLMCGPAGSGKTTYVKNQLKILSSNGIHISRDIVRNSFLSENDKNIFAYEDEVFDEFCRQIKVALENENGADNIFADATHLSEKARNKVLDRLNLVNVKIYPVVFNLSLQKIIAQNEQRKGMNRAYVPQSVIRKMYASFKKPTYNEKYKYAGILEIGDDDKI